jgi:RNA processing factor Prp31
VARPGTGRRAAGRRRLVRVPDLGAVDRLSTRRGCGSTVDAGFAADEDDYYDRLHEATVEATRVAAREAGRADDQQLIHAVRAMDDTGRVA